MPLVVSTLQASLTQLATHPGADVPACAQAWASAVRDYAAAVVPLSTTVAAAGLTLQSQLTAAFAVRPSAAPAMESAFLAFATAVGLGMAGYVPAPPPGPIGLAALFTQPYPTTSALAAQGLATAIDAWMHTGTAALIPGGPPGPWA